MHIRGAGMKFKFAALAGCSLATLLASAPPAMAQEAFGGAPTEGPAVTHVSSVNAEVAESAQTFALEDLTLLTLDGDASTDAAYVTAQFSDEPEQGPWRLRTLDRPAAQAAGAPADQSTPEERRWLSEVRLGLLGQDIGPITNDVESGAAVNLEVLFNAPDMLRSIGSPRPHLGVSAATDPYATSYVYAGLTWEHEFREHWFLIGGFGLALHDGEFLRKSDLAPEEWGRQKTLGCRVDFHWGIGVGRRLSERWNFALHYKHVSSGDVCVRGALGLENVGFRAGYVF